MKCHQHQQFHEFLSRNYPYSILFPLRRLELGSGTQWLNCSIRPAKVVGARIWSACTAIHARKTKGERRRDERKERIWGLGAQRPTSTQNLLFFLSCIVEKNIRWCRPTLQNQRRGMVHRPLPNSPTTRPLSSCFHREQRLEFGWRQFIFLLEQSAKPAPAAVTAAINAACT